MGNDDAIARMIELGVETLTLAKKVVSQVDVLNAKVDVLDAKVDAIDTKVDAIDTKVDSLSRTLERFRADTQDEFAIITSRLYRLEHPPTER